MARVRVRGAAKVRRKIARVPTKAEEGGMAGLKNWAKVTQAVARQLAPRRTGNLRRDIRTRYSSATLTARVGVWADDAFYARFQEFGTSHHAAQPFLMPAWEANRKYVIQDVTSEIRRRVES